MSNQFFDRQRSVVAAVDAQARSLLESLVPLGLAATKMADVLNAAGIPNTVGETWKAHNVRDALSRMRLKQKWLAALRSKPGGYTSGAEPDHDEQRQIEESARHLCHGWTDARYHKHPCPDETMTSDYRCSRCQQRHKLGRDIVRSGATAAAEGDDGEE